MFNLRYSLPNKRVPLPSCTEPSNFLHVLCAMKAWWMMKVDWELQFNKLRFSVDAKQQGEIPVQPAKTLKGESVISSPLAAAKRFQILLVNLEPGLHFSSFATRHLFPRCRWCTRCRWGCGGYDTCRDAGVACWRSLHHCFQIQVVKVGMYSHHTSSLMRRKEQTAVLLSRSNVIWMEHFHTISGLWCFPDASNMFDRIPTSPSWMARDFEVTFPAFQGHPLPKRGKCSFQMWRSANNKTR